MKKVSAQLIYREWKDDNCHWGLGVDYGNAPGAESYLVTYWDGYFQQVTSHTISAAEANAKPQKELKIPTGSHYVGATGGNGGGIDCKLTGGDPTGGGRFSKGAKAWAIFPANAKPSIDVSIAAPATGTTVGDTIGVKVKVTAGTAPLTSVRLGSGLQVQTQLAEITSGPGAVAGFSLGAGATRVFTYTLKALRKGTANLTIAVSGQSKRGSVSGKATARVEITPETSVSGTVYEAKCGESCGRVGLEGVPVLVKGTTEPVSG